MAMLGGVNGRAFVALCDLRLNEVISATDPHDTNVVRVCRITAVHSTSATPTQALQHYATDEKNVQDEFVIRVTHQKGPLGQGAFGDVYDGKLSHEKADVRSVCIKQADLRADPHFESLANEHRTYSLLRIRSHDNFLQSYGMFVHGVMGFLIIDYFEGESLHRIMDSDKDATFPYRKMLDIMTQLMTALKYLHENKIIHLDVKPDNILYSEKRKLKLIDFGLSCELKDSDTSVKLEPRGTSPFMAPEMLLSEWVGPRTDVFSAGLTAYNVITRRRPILKNEGIDWSHLPTGNIWKGLIDIIKVMCCYIYDERPFSKEVLDQLLALPVPKDEQDFNPMQPVYQQLEILEDELPLVSAISSGHDDDPDSYCDLLPEVADDFRDSEIVSTK